MVIDGRPSAVAEFRKEELDFAPVRLWDEEERHRLPADVRQMFVRAATAPVSPKTNKLTAPRIVTADNKFLSLIHI